MAFRYGERFLAGEDVRLAGKPFQQVIASGGSSVSDITDGGLAYRLHVFNASGDFTVTFPGVVEVEMIGGGGGGGSTPANGSAGGGGAGQYERFFTTVTPGIYAMVIGAGGSGIWTPSRGNKSTAFGMTCIGGSSTVYDQANAHEMSVYCGACGGGMTSLSVYALMSSANIAGVIHFNGGTANRDNTSEIAGGGGGGVGGAGANAAQNVGGNGGVGIETFFTGVSTFLGGGGGGGCQGATGTQGLGGSGIGGNGALQGLTGGLSGTANTGSGGGGGTRLTNDLYRGGGNGGSGVVRIRYRIG